MQKPDLNRVWETFIKIGLPQDMSLQQIISLIRSKVYPMICDLRNRKIINWYFFLIHGRGSGVPTIKEDNNAYFHIRFSLNKDIEVKNEKDVINFLPNYCVLTQKARHKRVESILGIDKSLLKNEEIEEAWRIMGQQSEWIIDMLNIHKENVEILIPQIVQFMHFFLNMLGLGKRALLFLGPVYSF